MSRAVSLFSAVPDKLVQLLIDELPYSLPLLRRLQFAKLENGTTPHAHIIVASDFEALEDDPRQPGAFTAAYVDLSARKNTQMSQVYMYSTLEHRQGSERAARDEYEHQIASVIKEIIRLGKAYDQGEKSTSLDGVLLGSVHSAVRSILEDKFGHILRMPSGNCDKWLFRIEDVPQFNESLPEDMYWDSATLDDCRLISSRNHIPRQAESLVRFPSVVIKLKDSKTPIAWGLLGVDGGLLSVHCEDAYRRKGLAKTLAAKLIRENVARFGNDGWRSADVADNNTASQAMCRALNGRPYWVTSWVFLPLKEVECCKDTGEN